MAAIAGGGRPYSLQYFAKVSRDAGLRLAGVIGAKIALRLAAVIVTEGAWHP